jgi:hypothetical protein
VVGITGRVRVVEQDLQCSADRADEGSNKRRRADLFRLAGERLLQVPGDLALGVELDLQDAHPTADTVLIGCSRIAAPGSTMSSAAWPARVSRRAG